MASEIKVDTISEKTSANGVTIDGVSLKDSKIATANSVDSDAYVDGSIDTAHIDALQVTGAKLNTDVISAQTALAAEPADTDEFMVSDAGVLKRVDYSYIKGGDNTPAFHAYLGSDQSPSDATWTTASIDTELYDTDGCFATDTYKFTPTTAGKYFFYGQAQIADNAADNMNLYAIAIRKNTSYASMFQLDGRFTAWGDGFSATTATTLDMDGSSDYVTLYMYYDGASGSPTVMSTAMRTFIGGFRIAGA